MATTASPATATSPAAPTNSSNNAIVSPATAPAKPPTNLATISGTNTVHRTDTPPKSQRGQNKPKCRQCGNVARSRCPYESCKSCCARNQNPCHIHVLKANSNLSEKSPSSAAAPLDQQSSETSQSTSASRAASLRQLSNSFAQFNNLHVSLRSRKPLTRKDAVVINEWRLLKLKEYKERNIEVENEAFDRYMQNVELLEEVFSVESMEDNVSSVSGSNQTSEETNTMIPNLKSHLRSNSVRSDSMRMRIQEVVDEGLKKVQNCASDEPIDDEPNQASKKARTERFSAISDLVEKLNKARNEEDLKPCLEMKSQLFHLDKVSCKIEFEDDETPKNEFGESDNAPPAIETYYSLPKLVGVAEVDQETINTIDKYFSSMVHVEEL